MNRKLGIFIGIAILFLVFLIGFLVQQNKQASEKQPSAHLTGFLGGEKIGLFEDAAFKDIAAKNYQEAIDYTKVGSIDMSRRDLTGIDYAFPSSQVALEIFKQANGNKVKQAQTVFYSPIVMYSWSSVADALVKQGIAQKQGEVYTIDTIKLIDLINEGKSWKDIGLPELYGKVSVITTDPSKSNSGNMFTGLLANVLSGGQVATDANLPTILPKIKDFYAKLGFLSDSSADIFDQYIKTGLAKPIIVGYENQMIEFSQQNPEVWKSVKDKVVVFYPTPTVWSEHPVIALSDNGKRMIQLLSDPAVQDLAWKKHGFRSAIPNIQNDTTIFNMKGIPTSVSSVMQMPTATVMDQLINNLK